MAVAVLPQPTSAVRQGDQLAKYLKQEAKEYVQHEERQEMAMDNNNSKSKKAAFPKYVQLE